MDTFTTILVIILGLLMISIVLLTSPVEGAGLVWRAINKAGSVLNDIGAPTSTYSFGNQLMQNIKLEDNSATIVDNSANTKQIQFEASSITAGQTSVITIPDADTTLVGTGISQTLTSKTIDADSNAITNIDNNEIKAAAGIDKSKISSTGTWTAAEIPSLDASKITTGTVGTARLGSDTANSTTFLRGDQTWATIYPKTLVDTTLGSAAATISGSWAGNYQQLQVILVSPGQSAAGIPQIRFNGDTGAAAYTWNAFGIIATAVVDAQDSSDDAIQLTGTTTDAQPLLIKLDVMNFQTTRKVVSADTSRIDAIATNPESWVTAGGWENTSNFITSVEFSSSAGNYNSGTRLIVLGTP